MQINRLFEIIYLLLEHKAMTANELADRFEVSIRTIYRDVDTLSQSGIPIYACKGRGGGIRLMENFILNKSVLSKEEQYDILSSLQGMNALQIDGVHSALEKLSALFGSEAEDWIEVNFSSWQANPIDQRFNLLKKAILNCHIVNFEYSGTNKTTLMRTVEPMKLIFRSYDWYLLGWCQQKQDFRYFKLLRMNKLNLTEKIFKKKSMQSRSYNQTDTFHELKIDLTVHIIADFAYRVKDEFSPEQWVLQSDGSFLVHFQMAENHWLYEYLMAYGKGLVVLEPENIRLKLMKRFQEALEQYEEIRI